MSADNSPESESTQRTRARDSSRYDRAAQTEAAKLTPDLTQRRQESRDATREQARQDRDARDAARAKLRGKAAELDDVAALFGGAPAEPKNRSNASDGAATRSDDAGDAGRSPEAPPPKDRPALELDEEGEGDEPRRGRGKTIEQFCEEHELKSQKAIYNLEVAVDETGDERISLGALKDHYKEHRDLEARRDEFETWRIDAQGEVLQARTKIEGVLRRLPDYLPADVLARVSAEFDEDAAIQRERAQAQIREWFPEWRDVQVKARDREKLIGCLGTYGFSELEVGNVADARLIKFAVDAMRLMERHKRLRDEWTREKQPSREPVSTRRERRISATERANQLAAAGDTIGAVESLIKAR
jgi:hypothetical protein